MTMPPGHDRPLVVLGAGLAGLSLADALLEAGIGRPIVLIDRRRAWERDRTWCTWLTGPLPHGELADHRWWSWRTAWRGHETIARTARHPYVHLRSDTVYAALLERLDGAAGVELRAGERVLGVDTGGPRPLVRTSREAFEADLVFDAMGPSSPLLAGRDRGQVELSQRFLGWEVEADRPVFDPGTATLMDLRPTDGDGVCFWYVLPFSPTRALVEHTTIGARGPAVADRRRAIERELAETFRARDWRVHHEEQGAIPMTTASLHVGRGAGVVAVGAAAGAIRPSSGYAFSRIQRQVAALAAQLAAGRPPTATAGPARLELLDRVFLFALAGRADGGAELFWRIADRVAADPFARFMTDASSPAEEARIAAVLPWSAMARAALDAHATPARMREALALLGR